MSKKSMRSYLTEHPVVLTGSFISVTAAALLLTLIPADFLSQSNFGYYDGIGHALLFGAWTFLMGLYRLIKLRRKIRLSLVFLAGLLFGGAIELLQYLLPIQRSAQISDLIFDAIGCLLAVGALYLINKEK